MRKLAPIVVAIQAASVSALAVLIATGRMPLGVPGEWEWPRIKSAPPGFNLAAGLAAVLGYSAFAASGYRAMGREGGPRRIKAWLSGLVLASVVVQGAAQEAAPEGFGLSKWIFALHSPGSSGYYTVAKAQMGDPRRFLADYPSWIGRQDALHVGTHPPGLFVVARVMLGATEAHPAVARAVCDLAPASAGSAILVYRTTVGLPRADAASLAMTGALTLLACSATVVPLYWLARASLAGPASWASAALWPVVPSALMFQPAADTAFPLLSATALALACWSARVGANRGTILAIASGLVLAIGMEFTLAFLPVGLVVAIVLLTGPEATWSRRIGLILAVGLGFVGGTLAWWAISAANPPAIWWANQKNHARFYVEYPRNLPRLGRRGPRRAGRRARASRRHLGGDRPRFGSSGPPSGLGDRRRARVPDGERQEPQRGRPALAPADAAAPGRGGIRSGEGRRRTVDARLFDRAGGPASVDPGDADPGGLSDLRRARFRTRPSCALRRDRGCR